MKRFRTLVYKQVHLFLLALFPLAMPVFCATDCQLSNSPGGCPILVQATILSGCQISGLTSANLGDLNFGSAPSVSKQTITTSLLFNSAITLDCTPNTNLLITIDSGLNNNGNYNMSDSQGNLQPYQLYLDKALTQPITANQSITWTTPKESNGLVLPIYAVTNLTANLSPGNYSDTLTVDISW